MGWIECAVVGAHLYNLLEILYGHSIHLHRYYYRRSFKVSDKLTMLVSNRRYLQISARKVTSWRSTGAEM